MDFVAKPIFFLPRQIRSGLFHLKESISKLKMVYIEMLAKFE